MEAHVQRDDLSELFADVIETLEKVKDVFEDDEELRDALSLDHLWLEDFTTALISWGVDVRINVGGLSSIQGTALARRVTALLQGCKTFIENAFTEFFMRRSNSVPTDELGRLGRTTLQDLRGLTKTIRMAHANKNHRGPYALRKQRLDDLFQQGKLIAPSRTISTLEHESLIENFADFGYGSRRSPDLERLLDDDNVGDKEALHDSDLLDARVSMQQSSRIQRDEGEREPLRAPRPGDKIIVIMGMTGSGKSSFISHFAAERRVGISHTVESYTSDVELYHCRDAELGTFWLTDTPGFNHTYLSDAQVLESIVTWLNAAYRNEIQLSGILHLHSIQETTVSGSAARSLGWLRQLTGARALRKVLLVTTFWDLVPSRMPLTVAENRQRQLGETNHWRDMISLGARTERHNHTLASAREVIRRLLPTPTTNDEGTYAAVQEEMARGMRLEETTVGRDINRYLDQQREYFDQQLSNLRRQLQETLQTITAQPRAELEQDRATFERRRSRLQEDQDRLRANVSELDERLRRFKEESVRRFLDERFEFRAEEGLRRVIPVLDSRKIEAAQRMRARERDSQQDKRPSRSEIGTGAFLNEKRMEEVS